MAPSQVAQDTASVPTLDEVYSQHKQGQLQDMLRPEWQQPAAFTQVDHNESAYQDEKMLLGKMLKDPVNLGYTSPQILSAAANSYNPQAMKDMAVAHRATAFLLDTPVEDLDPQKMSVYQKAVAARLAAARVAVCGTREPAGCGTREGAAERERSPALTEEMYQ